MDWSDVGNSLKILVPTVATMLGGPLAGQAVTALENVLGFAPGTGTPDTITAAIQADPQSALKLKQMETDLQMLRITEDTKRMNAQLADVQGARQMATDQTKTTGKRDYNLYALAWCIIAGVFGLIAILLFVKLPDDSTGVVFMLFGTLSAAFGSVVQYFFGSSKSSADKTDILARSQPIPPQDCK